MSKDLQYKPDAFVGTKAVLVNDGKVLLLKRSIKLHQNPGKWGLPGGRLEKNEQPIDGIKREIEEETKLVVDKLRIFDAQTFKIDVGMALVIFYVAETDVSEIELNNEHDEYRWVELSEIDGMGADEVVKEIVYLAAKEVSIIK